MPEMNDAPLPRSRALRDRAVALMAALAFIMALVGLGIAVIAYSKAQEALRHANDATTGARNVKVIKP